MVNRCHVATVVTDTGTLWGYSIVDCHVNGVDFETTRSCYEPWERVGTLDPLEDGAGLWVIGSAKDVQSDLSSDRG